jgi:hypothetical protein
MPTLRDRFAAFLHPRTDVARNVSVSSLTANVTENDSTFYPGTNMKSMYRSRYDYDRRTILANCLSLWRTNAIARRIVKLMSMFVVGEGIALSSDHKATNDYLQIWWNHPLNQIGRKCIPWMEEAVRAGNLFFLCTADQNTGMLYIRAVPADQVDEIITADNDVDQELAYKPVDPLKDPWPAYNPQSSIVDRQSSPFMLHYAFNQPVGVPWGEPDLAPMVDWLNWYSQWLEDRCRLNKYRNAYMYVVNGNFADKAAKDARWREIMMNPPSPGNVLVTSETEQWSILNPQLHSSEAGEDGLALKKMIAIGAGMPPHYFAEPESSTKTTAEAAGTPTFRGLEQTQTIFLSILEELASIAVLYRKQFDRRVNPSARIEATGPDITERDNSILALAASRIYPAFSEIFDRGGIDEKELLRVVYRMSGEVLPSDTIPPMQRRPLKPVGAGLVPAHGSSKSTKSKPSDTDPDSPPPVDENP